MTLRSAPQRKSVDYRKLDQLQKEIFESEQEDANASLITEFKDQPSTKNRFRPEDETIAPDIEKVFDKKARAKSASPVEKAEKSENFPSSETGAADESPVNSAVNNRSTGEDLNDLQTIAARITSSKAGQGRTTTRPFSLPRTLIIDTTRLKAQFRLIDEQFTQNIIIDFLLREALAAITPENYQDVRTEAFEFIKRAEETTRRSLTVTEEAIYQMSELKAGINLDTGKKYSNDEIFSTLLAVGVSRLYRGGVLS